MSQAFALLFGFACVVTDPELGACALHRGTPVLKNRESQVLNSLYWRFTTYDLRCSIEFRTYK